MLVAFETYFITIVMHNIHSHEIQGGDIKNNILKNNMLSFIYWTRNDSGLSDFNLRV